MKNRKQKATKTVEPDKIANMADNLGVAEGGELFVSEAMTHLSDSDYCCINREFSW